jgi:hypothetical protein
MRPAKTWGEELTVVIVSIFTDFRAGAKSAGLRQGKYKKGRQSLHSFTGKSEEKEKWTGGEGCAFSGVRTGSTLPRGPTVSSG